MSGNLSDIGAICPWCGSVAELVTHGAIETTSLMSVKRSPEYPHGMKRYTSRRQVPFFACTGCEWCKEVA